MYPSLMRAVPGGWVAERKRRGLDRYDEVWGGVLHMVPGPNFDHQRIGTRLLVFLRPLLVEHGIEMQYETEVHRPGSKGNDYRIPDLVFFPADRPDLLTTRGIEGAPLAVVEIRSPDDETYAKLPFYAALGVQEVIVIQPEARVAEVYRLAGGRYLALSADERGRVHAATIDAWFSTVKEPEPRLRVERERAALEV